MLFQAIYWILKIFCPQFQILQLKTPYFSFSNKEPLTI
jgi:hypothetical protein